MDPRNKLKAVTIPRYFRKELQNLPIHV